MTCHNQYIFPNFSFVPNTFKQFSLNLNSIRWFRFFTCNYYNSRIWIENDIQYYFHYFVLKDTYISSLLMHNLHYWVYFRAEGFRPYHVQTRILVRSPKLNNLEHGYYLNGWALGNVTSCELRYAGGLMHNGSESE